jgi:NAD(P)-dependent dehydrogenase (short-subunit alcohol dehydrogenase family)
MNKTALITGATGGLGTSVAERFLADGWRVVAPARSAAPDRESDRNPALQIVEGDLTDAAAVQGVVAHAAGKAEAPLQAVVNLVGGYAGGARVHETPIEDFERQFTANLRPTYLVTQAALPHLRPGAAIVCVSSRAALQPFSGAAGYIASKAAVIAFAQAVAVEYREEAIRCKAVLPSVIDTPANRRAQPGADHARWVSPDRIAEVIRFLCDATSEAITGAAVPVYGRA